MSSVEYVKFPIRELTGRQRLMAAEGGYSLILPEIPPLSTCGQFVGKHAARRLLQQTEALDRPVDVFLQMSWLSGVAVHAITPCALSEISSSIGDTTLISHQKTLRARFEREILRPIYRARIARLARRHFTNLENPNPDEAEGEIKDAA
jgi:GR25 family glycosyltransferase involved in LPS biosynthesis